MSTADKIEVDDMGQKETFRRVLHYIKKYWLYLAASIVMASVTVALTLYFPILTGKVIDLVLGPGVRLLDSKSSQLYPHPYAGETPAGQIPEWVGDPANGIRPRITLGGLCGRLQGFDIASAAFVPPCLPA